MTALSIPEFKSLPVNKNSIANRRLLYGICINDADYMVSREVNGKRVICPIYSKWKDMIARCYSKRYHAKHPTYINCSVTQEWYSFMVFKSWMITQDWKGKSLDKDILIPGNKVYSPSTCLFVSQSLNNLLNDRAAARGELPQGVTFNAQVDRYKAEIRTFGKGKSLGCFATPEEASAVYREAKRAHILRIAAAESDIRIKKGLFLHSLKFTGEIK